MSVSTEPRPWHGSPLLANLPRRASASRAKPKPAAKKITRDHLADVEKVAVINEILDSLAFHSDHPSHLKAIKQRLGYEKEQWSNLVATAFNSLKSASTRTPSETRKLLLNKIEQTLAEVSPRR